MLPMVQRSAVLLLSLNWNSMHAACSRLACHMGTGRLHVKPKQQNYALAAVHACMALCCVQNNTDLVKYFLHIVLCQLQQICCCRGDAYACIVAGSVSICSKSWSFAQ